MKRIEIDQITQPDGSIHHKPKKWCADSPCAVITKAGEVPEKICPFLHGDKVDDDGTLTWLCNNGDC